jgi:methionyl aminopeptidase
MGYPPRASSKLAVLSLAALLACHGPSQPTEIVDAPKPESQRSANPAPAPGEAPPARPISGTSPSASDQETAASVLADVFSAIEPRLVPGITTQDIDEMVARDLAARGASSYFLGYNGFSAHCTTSINEEVINTRPSSRRLRSGDLLKLQIGIRVGGRFATQSWTYAIGTINATDAALLAAGVRALRAGVQQAKAGARVGDISAAIQSELATADLAPSHDFVGHGMGEKPHEDPPVPGYGIAGRGYRLHSGKVLSIVVLGHTGSPEVSVLDDGWNVVAVDGKKSILFSQMVMVGDSGPGLLLPERATPSRP